MCFTWCNCILVLMVLLCNVPIAPSLSRPNNCANTAQQGSQATWTQRRQQCNAAQQQKPTRCWSAKLATSSASVAAPSRDQQVLMRLCCCACHKDWRQAASRMEAAEQLEPHVRGLAPEPLQGRGCTGGVSLVGNIKIRLTMGCDMAMPLTYHAAKTFDMHVHVCQ